ncbi:MAG: hypothetical protein ACJ79A_16875 [Gemmatimonadaceae bacterium]
MFRMCVVVIVLFFVSACEGRQRGLSRAGPSEAFAAERADTARATTRRLQGDDRTDYQVAPLPDGVHVIVTDWWDTGDLVIRDIRTGAVQRLTHNTAPSTPGEAMGARVSRDGKRVAFTWVPIERSEPNELRIMELAGSEPRTIYREAAPRTFEVYPEDWSPDGRWILALRRKQDGTREITLVSVNGDSTRVVKALGWRAPVRMNFSADGRFIAYDFPTHERSNADREIYVRELATGRESVIAKHPANDFLLGWAPDGSHILFGSDRSGTRGAWLVRVADGKALGEPTLVRPDLWGINEGSFIPDGSFFYNVVSGMLGLYVANLDPATGRVIGTPTLMPRSGEHTERWPEWSPDGRLVATVADRDRTPGSSEWSIRIWSVDKGEYRDLPLSVELREVTASWAADGRSLLVRSLEKSQFSVHRLDVQSGKLEPVFTLRPGVQLGLMRVRADGRTLVYFTGEPAKDGLTTRSITLRDLSTGVDRTVCRRTGKPAGGRRLYGALSPDGSTRASLLLEDSTKNGLLQIETIAQLCTGEPTTLVTIPYKQIAGFPGIGWSPDSRSLTFLRRLTEDPDPRSEMWRISIDGGTPERVGVSMAGLMAQTISRDGRRMAFVGGESHDELWVMTNILPPRGSPATPK